MFVADDPPSEMSATEKASARRVAGLSAGKSSSIEGRCNGTSSRGEILGRESNLSPESGSDKMGGSRVGDAAEIDASAIATQSELK
jgi:hypothetical protein